MAIVSAVTKRAPIPHEDGEWMELRRLSWRQLEKASDVQSDALMERMKRLGGDVLVALRNSATEQQQDPASGYDQATVLQAGIVKWSYKERVSPENIDALDEKTATWAMREILAMNAPRTEEERKNGL